MDPHSSKPPPSPHNNRDSTARSQPLGADTNTSATPELPPPPYSKDPIIHNTSASQPQRPGSTMSASSLSIHHMLNSENSHQHQHQQQSLPLPHVSPEQRDLSAAEALTQLTGSATPPSDADTMVTTDYDEDCDMADSEHQQQQHHHHQQRHPLVSTVSMVAKHPIVMNAVKYYETSKRRYSSFNYAAGIVEAAAIPVVTRIEDNLNTRHQTKRHVSSSSSSSHGAGSPLSPTLNQYSMSSFDNKQKKRRLSSSSAISVATTSSQSGIVPSSDAKRRLQFCIHILRAANATINSKINFLQLKLDETEMAIKEKRHQLQAQRSNESIISDQTTEKTKGEIVGTVKKIIHLISNFRPSTLSATAPTQAAQATQTTETTPATPTTPAACHPNTLSRTSSFNGTPVPSGSTGTANTPTTTLTPTSSHGSCLQEYELKNTIRDIILRLPASLQHAENDGGNDRIFVFAKESLEMITKLTNVFSSQLEHVETWVNGEVQEPTNETSGGVANEINDQEKENDVEMKDEKNFDSASTRCSSEEPDGITSATKRMRIDELIEN
ncbi:OPI1 [Candida margitis]|uniref:OPI1 n=1 Tax=Candida margitis TaxID=1775924 RepID=UPI002225F260|nr:OPI1 [Candida margitis]KAI5969736.1 OPI1 [Candida margitis]